MLSQRACQHKKPSRFIPRDRAGSNCQKAYRELRRQSLPETKNGSRVGRFRQSGSELDRTTAGQGQETAAYRAAITAIDAENELKFYFFIIYRIPFRVLFIVDCD